MNTGHWHDRYTRPQLAAALDALGDRAPVVTLAAMALRNGDRSDELADALDDHAHTIALRWGNYDGHAVCSDAAEALRPIDDSPATRDYVDAQTAQLRNELAASGIESGTFRELRSSCIAGVAVTEYEAETPTARYVTIDCGPFEPPELKRVYASDPDEDQGDEA
jgi:hypothetical protein